MEKADDSDTESESSTNKKHRIDHAMEPRDGNDVMFKPPKAATEGPRHFSQRSSSGDGSQVQSSSDTGSRRRVHTVSTSSTDPSSFGVPYMSTESNPGTCGAPATGERSIHGDDMTSESSQINITRFNALVIGDNNTIINLMKRNQEDEDACREERFIEQFKSIAPLFVETKRYHEAKMKLEKNHLVLITGSPGEGKSFMAKKLVQEKIDQGYNLREVDNIIQWREHVQWRKRQVVFIDDLFGLSHHTDKDDDHQKLIYQVGLITDEGNTNEDLLYVIMTCKTSVLIRIKEHLKTSQVFEESNIVNLSTIELTQNERLQMIETHLSKYRENNTLDDAVKQSISTCDCPVGFPYCVYMFTRITKLFVQERQFFISPIENVRQEVHHLHKSDSYVYALLVFLLIKGGEIKEETLHRIGEDSNEFKLLKNIVDFLNGIQLGNQLQKALKRVDNAFIMKNGTNLQFRHSCVSDAMCISFSRNMEHIAIQWLPFDFIVNRIRTDFEKSVDDEIVTIYEKVYKDLANRFVEEIELGNISKVCQHQALSDPRFVVYFIGVLEVLRESDIGKLRLILQVTEQENQFGALLNGSLLYWTSSLGMRYLCSSLLERKFYDIIEDRFWVQTQASAALVPACWYGFESSVLQDLLNLGADINSSLHEVKKLQTHDCDYCTVHDQDGMTTIQASVFGDDKHKDKTVKFLLDKGAHFKELSKHRPLIRAIKIYNKEFESGPVDMNITKRTICTLLEGGADINWKDQNDRTAFWYIVINNNIDIARLLISKCRNISPQSLLPFAKSMDMAKLLVDNNIDTDFSQKDNLGKTLLHRVQHESLVQYFIENNCSVQQRDSDGRTPIFYSQTLPICEKLIQNRSSINTEDYEQKTVFHFIKRTEILKYLLDSFPGDEVRRIINKEDMFKRTPIFTCTSLTVLRLFTNHEADVNHKAKEYSVRGNELGGACQHGDKIYNISLESTTKETKLSNVLVYTANYILNIPENYSEVPDDEFEAMDQLTNTLCSVNTTDSYSKSTSNTRSTKTNNSSDNCSEENDEETSRKDYTVAMKLALSGKLTLEIIQELKRNRADFNITDDESNTFIHYLLAPEHRVNQVVSIIETVLDPNDDQWNGHLVNAKNSCGNTPLHLACACLDLNQLLHSRKDVVATLLQSGADVHAQNKSKETPLHCLLKCSCTDKDEISKLLQQHGLNEEDVYSTNQAGELAIEQICSLQDQSKRFLNDAKNTILSLYKNLALKDYLLQHIEFFLKSCNISLIETVFECCPGLSTNDCNEVRRCCVSTNYRLSVNSWVIMSSVDLIDKRERLSDIKLEVMERHSLLKDCIVRVQSRTTRKKILVMIMDGIEDINATDSKGRSFLINAIIACRYRRNDLHRVIEYFLEIGSDPNMRDVDGFTAYHHCILSNIGDEYVHKCTKLLYDNKASLSIGKPLLLLVDINRLRTKNIIFLPRSVLPNQKDEKGNAFHHLMIAYSKYASNFHVLTTSISALIGHGVDINMYNEDGETPLHVAMRCQVQSHVILEMLRNGADVKREKKRSNHDNENVSMEIDSETQDDITHDVTRNDNGRSPFEYMLIHQQNIKLQVVREMLKYGADPFHQDKNGQNSFHLLTSVVKSNCLKILLLLLKYCKNTEDNLSMCDKNRDTPLHIACTFSNNDEVWCTSLRVAVIRILLASGASINKVNDCGQTPFHLLIGQYCQLTNNFRIEDNKIIHNIIAVLSLFLSYKANMTIKDKKGLSVLDVINENINSDLQRFIQNQIGAVALMNLLDKTPTKEGTTGVA